MKKIYLFMLLAVSMCFASVSVTAFQDGTRFKPGINIHLKNNGDEVRGFKVVYYLKARGGGYQFRLFPVNMAGATYKSFPDDIAMYSQGTRIARIELDFSNVTLAAGAHFPAANKNITFHLDYYSQQAVVENLSSDISGDIVVESLSGDILWGSRRAKIGVLKNGSNFSCDEEVSITIDAEDSNNGTTVVSGNTTPPGISLGGTVTFTYCTFEVSSLRPVPYDYAVLKLSYDCPAGSYSIKRHHDTEDSDNANGHTGYFYPNVITDNADLYYCFMPGRVNATKWLYPFSTQYGIFANPSTSYSNMAHSEIYIDDEDSNNGNSWSYDFKGLSWFKKIDMQARANAIMNGTSNTTYHVIKWSGSTLGKTTGNSISVENSLVAASPLAPAIKGLNRSAVAVEIKSKGAVKISIVNANGSVVANVNQENLQPGVHNIMWNSGMVPSGRYIVKIEQNGKVNAKSVILK